MPQVNRRTGELELTRKQRREQARGERKALQQAQAARAARRTRLTQLGGVVAVVVIAIVVIVIATGSGGKKTVTLGTPQATATSAEVSALVGGIPQGGNALGSPAAPVTLQYFGDLECPICRDFTLESLSSIIPKWVRTGELRIEYHSMETATHEPEVFETQQVAALAAGKQSKMWNFVETFYHEQGEEDSGYVNEKYLQGIASQVPGLNLAKWASDRAEPELAKDLESDKRVVSNEGFGGTPSFLIGRSGSAMKKLEYSSPSDPTFVNEAVEKLLKE